MKHSRFLGVFFILSFLAGCSHPGVQVTERFYRALERGDTDDAANYVSREITDLTGRGKLALGLREAAKQIQKCGGLKSVKTVISGNGKRQSGETVLEFKGDCPNQVAQTELVKEDGKWKVTTRAGK